MDELIISRVPQSIEAEQAVLGSMLIDARCIPDVIGKLRPEHFYMAQNREIFEVIFSMFNYSQVIDPITVLEQMKQNGVYNENSSKPYILQLMDITPTAANVMDYVQILIDKAMLRAIGDIAADISKLVQNEEGKASEILELAEKRLYALRSGKNVGGLEHISSVLFSTYELLGELSKREGDVPGIPTGFNDLDSVIAGLNESDLIFVAARPGMGKTSFALNIALNAGKRTSKAIAIFSLEMSKEQLASRLISSEAFIDSKKLVTGKLSQDDWKKVAEASSAISSTNIYVDDNPSLTVAEMNASCRRIENLGLVIIDYLQLMQSAGGKNSSNENRVQIVSDISRSLKIMAKELKVPIICLSQLNRATEGGSDKRPGLANLRESGSIEQDADIVLFLYREDYYNETTENRNVAECIIAKNRKGATGTINLKWMPQYTTFSAMEWMRDEE